MHTYTIGQSIDHDRDIYFKPSRTGRRHLHDHHLQALREAKAGALQDDREADNPGVDTLPDADLVGDLVFLVQDQVVRVEDVKGGMTLAALGDVCLRLGLPGIREQLGRLDGDLVVVLKLVRLVRLVLPVRFVLLGQSAEVVSGRVSRELCRVG